MIDGYYWFEGEVGSDDEGWQRSSPEVLKVSGSSVWRCANDCCLDLKDFRGKFIGPLIFPLDIPVPPDAPLPWEAFAEKVIVANPERVRVVIRAANSRRIVIEENPRRWSEALVDFEFICRTVNSASIPAPQFKHGQEIVAKEERYNPRCPAGGVRICHVTEVKYILVEFNEPVNKWEYELTWDVHHPDTGEAWAKDHAVFDEATLEAGITYSHDCKH